MARSRTTRSTAIASLPGELQGVASRWFERFDAENGDECLPQALVAPLSRLVAISDFAGNVALRDWSFLRDHWQTFDKPPNVAALKRFAGVCGASNASIEKIKRDLRRFRNRQMLHVLWRESAGLADLDETLTSLSMLADELLGAACACAQRHIRERFGRVLDASGEPVPLVVLGMGKLGGRELNFSSDIDLIFLYTRGGKSNGKRSLSAQEYFARLTRQVIALLDEVTADGFVFRVDTRLRPFGDSGPPVVSFAALESYLLQHGRSWERYAYVKARIVGPGPGKKIADELFSTVILPFVYRRYLDYGVFESLRNMHALIAAEVQRRELESNIKLGPGGIREIEFIVQSLQLVRGGSHPELQGAELQSVLPKLVGNRGLSRTAADQLLSAYRFLRKLENFIQAIRDQQSHDLPTDKLDRARLSLAMGYSSWKKLSADVARYRHDVTRQFDAIAFRGKSGARDDLLTQRLSELWERQANCEQWRKALTEEQYEDAENLAIEITKFQDAPATLKSDATSRRRLQYFMPQLLTVIRESSNGLLALTRTIAIIDQILRRSAYVALLNENHLAMRRLVGLCESSAYIAEQLARFPVLLDELLDPTIYTERVEKIELCSELEGRLGLAHDRDSEAQMEILAQFRRANLFRIAVADVSGNLPLMKVSDSLTYLAETVLEHALEVAWEDLTARHGIPCYELEGETCVAGLGVIAYGKLGGLELSYESDLDLVFLHDSRGSGQVTDGDLPIENAMFFARLVRRLVHFLTARTSSGALYEVDTRLRPSGRSGLLVTSTDAYARYQEENAWTWEHQALLRARPVAGSAEVAKEFTRIRSETLECRVRRDSLRQDVRAMRERIRTEHDHSDAGVFHLKQGSGGIGDIEFIVQYLVLHHAGREPSVFHFTDNIRQLEALAKAGCIEDDSAAELQDIYRRLRQRLHRMALNGQPPLVAAHAFSTERNIVMGAWDACLG